MHESLTFSTTIAGDEAQSARQQALVADLAVLKDRIWATDNGHCFVEREEILARCADGFASLSQPERYVSTLEQILLRISTPVEDRDIILGRMVEGPARHPMKEIPGGGLGHQSNPFGACGRMTGHLTPDYAALLSEGLRGIDRRAANAAHRLGTESALVFSRGTTRCASAIAAFARRYAASARARAGIDSANREQWLRAAAALDHVPDGPATDFFSALQSVWLMHLIFSCCVGGRDFGFGRMDQYLWPFYERDLRDGAMTRDDAFAWMAHFLLKTNEIGGVGSITAATKNVPCVATKQYLVLGGRDHDGTERWNDLSLLILEAAGMVRLPEPVLTVRLDADSAPVWKRASLQAAQNLQGQVHIYNDAIIVQRLIGLGFSPDEASDYTMTGCCRLDFPGHQARENYHNAVAWFVEAINYPAVDGKQAGEGIASIDDILLRLGDIARREMAAIARLAVGIETAQPRFHLESLLLRHCADKGADVENGGLGRNTCCHFIGGIATIADSLAALERIVFRDGGMPLSEYLGIVSRDFDGQEALLHRVRENTPKFGNDDVFVDELARRAGDVLLDAVDSIQDGRIHYAGFFSLWAHHDWGRKLPATPDGRRRGEPVSENMSPVYSADVSGPTAVLKSVAHLPLRRTTSGGLNVKFGGPVPLESLVALVEAFFRMGGLHFGLTVVDGRLLRGAEANPEVHRSLCVRVTGFSEYFVRLSPEMQTEVIRRTECSMPQTRE